MGPPAWTRLPAVTSARPTRPLMGERTRVHSRLSRAVATAACAACTVAAPRSAAAGPVVELLLRDRVAGGQLLRSLQATRGQRGGAVRLDQVGLGARQLGLVGARIDLEQHVPLAHLLARGEGHALDVARDARPDLDRLDGLEAADELVPFGDLALLDGGDADRRAVAAPSAPEPARGRGSQRPAPRRRSAPSLRGEGVRFVSFHAPFLFGGDRLPLHRNDSALRSAISGPTRTAMASAIAAAFFGARAAARRGSDNSCRKRCTTARR